MRPAGYIVKVALADEAEADGPSPQGKLAVDGPCPATSAATVDIHDLLGACFGVCMCVRVRALHVSVALCKPSQDCGMLRKCTGREIADWLVDFTPSRQHAQLECPPHLALLRALGLAPAIGRSTRYPLCALCNRKAGPQQVDSRVP